MNYYNHHIGDYAKKTGALSLIEHGVYLLLLHAYYGTEKPLPTGESLYRLAHAHSKAERSAVDSVIAQFWQKTATGFINLRAAKEIAKDRAFIERQRAAAKARWKENGNATADAETMPTHMPPHTNGIDPACHSAIPPIPIPIPIPKPNLNPTHTLPVFSGSRADSDAEKGSVCGTFTKVGGEGRQPKPRDGPIPSVDEVMDQLRKEHGRAGK